MPLPQPLSPAPLFSLPDENGDIHSLSDYKGKWVLIYFYPKDDTPGCTKQACDLRDNFSEYQKLGVIVLGISADPVESHQKFANKYQLPFRLLSDTKKVALTDYGVWRVNRTSFLIDPQGKIRKIYEKVNPLSHSKIVLDDLKKFQE